MCIWKLKKKHSKNIYESKNFLSVKIFIIFNKKFKYPEVSDIRNL